MKLLNETSDSKFVTTDYDEGDETTYKKRYYSLIFVFRMMVTF